MNGYERVGLIGVGAIGSPIATALIEAGHALAVHDVREEATAPLVARGAIRCDSPAAVGDVARTIFTSLPGPQILRDVVTGPRGLLEGTSLATLIDLSTVGSTVCGELAPLLAEAGLDYLDAPVSGGVSGAQARTLAVMASGERAVFERSLPLLKTFGAKVFWIGPNVGHGQTAKLINNLLSATAVAATSEAMAFAVRAGLDPTTLLDAINAGSGRNTATADKFPRQVLTRDFAAGFRLDLMAKDVGLCLDEARSRKAPMILGSAVEALWDLAALEAADDADHTEFVRLYERWLGVEVTGGDEEPAT